MLANAEEYRRLHLTVLEVERQLAASPDGASPVLLNFVANARQRLDALKIEIERQQDKALVEAATAAMMEAAREKALNESERQTFAGFLSDKYFQKSDFPDLDKFYAHTWDRLSEPGKAEMSARIWGGIRQQQYQFNDLPDDAKKDEALRAYQQMVRPSWQQRSLSHIAPTDRDDFVNAYASGDREQAYKILQRPTFSQNLGLSDTPSVESVPVNGTKIGNQLVVETSNSTTSDKSDASLGLTKSNGNLDISAIKLDNVTLSEMPETVIAPGLPRTSEKPGRSC